MTYIEKLKEINNIRKQADIELDNIFTDLINKCNKTWLEHKETMPIKDLCETLINYEVCNPFIPQWYTVNEKEFDRVVNNAFNMFNENEKNIICKYHPFFLQIGKDIDPRSLYNCTSIYARSSTNSNYTRVMGNEIIKIIQSTEYDGIGRKVYSFEQRIRINLDNLEVTEFFDVRQNPRKFDNRFKLDYLTDKLMELIA